MPITCPCEMHLPPSCLPPAPVGAEVPSATVQWHRGKCPFWGGQLQNPTTACWRGSRCSCFSPSAPQCWCLGSFRRCSAALARGEHGTGWVLVGEGKISQSGWENPSWGQCWVVKEPLGVPAVGLGDPWIYCAFFLLFPSSLSHFWVNAVAAHRDPVPQASPCRAKFCVSR